MASVLASSGAEHRVAAREEVDYRTRVFCPHGKPVSVLIVNISASGLMARTDAQYHVGERLRVMLPVVGVVIAVIRWALGGRIGCEFERPIDLPEYADVLAMMLKGR